jgi:tetratricopeptide (TPR) repeat protein
MRGLAAFLMNRMMRNSAGRWALPSILLVIGLGSFALYPSASTSGSSSDGLTVLLAGAFFTALGLFALVVALRVGAMQRRQSTTLQRVNEMKASGQLLPIPHLPPPPKGISADRIKQVEQYTRQMAQVPWGKNTQVAPADAPAIFNQAVARTRRIRGDWSKLSEPINIFAGLPAPWCWVGAAEVMYRLSYLQNYDFAPVGLQHGLKFVAEAQFVDPAQPDALVIRTRLLAGSKAPRWLELADQTVERLRQVAPNHPRLPDAEASIHLQRGESEAALACDDRIIANPATPEDKFSALANRASILQSLKRNDEALAAFRGVLEIDPNDAWVWHNMSVLLTQMGRFSEALDANTHALNAMDFALARAQRQTILAKMNAGTEGAKVE